LYFVNILCTFKWDLGWDLGFGMGLGLGFGIGMGMGFGIWDEMGWNGTPIPFIWAASIVVGGYGISIYTNRAGLAIWHA
jgi:hypothetical protein